MRVGSLSGDEPALAASETLWRGSADRIAHGEANLERGGTVKAVPFGQGREPWRGAIPGELRASLRCKQPL
jgi:hypothetical protein